MATTRHDTVVTHYAIDHPVHGLFPGLPRQKWQRRSCRDGAHGPCVYDWARVEVRPWHRSDRRHWVIARRSIARPQEKTVAVLAVDLQAEAASGSVRPARSWSVPSGAPSTACWLAELRAQLPCAAPSPPGR